MNDQDTELLEHLQRQALRYFVDLAQPANGLVADSTWEGSPASIAAVERHRQSRAFGAQRRSVASAAAFQTFLKPYLEVWVGCVLQGRPRSERAHNPHAVGGISSTLLKSPLKKHFMAHQGRYLLRGVVESKPRSLQV